MIQTSLTKSLNRNTKSSDENMKYVSLVVLLLSACSNNDLNNKPVYGKESGLPANCRAYVQVSVDGWRNGTYTISETMDALERNCGENGELWNYKPQ